MERVSSTQHSPRCAVSAHECGCREHCECTLSFSFLSLEDAAGFVWNPYLPTQSRHRGESRVFPGSTAYPLASVTSFVLGMCPKLAQ